MGILQNVLVPGVHLKDDQWVDIQGPSLIASDDSCDIK